MESLFSFLLLKVSTPQEQKCMRQLSPFFIHERTCTYRHAKYHTNVLLQHLQGVL